MAIIIAKNYSKIVSEQFPLSVPVAASGCIQGSVGKLTFTADTAGSAGNSIQVILEDGETAGSETVAVVGSVITVGIETGVSTAAQIKTALDADGDAAALINTAATTAGAMEADSVTLASGSDGIGSTVTNLTRSAVGTFTYTLERAYEAISLANLVVFTNHASTLTKIAKVEVLNFDATSYASTISFKLVDYAGSAADVDIVSTLLLSFVFNA